jgi:hypothetical protein
MRSTEILHSDEKSMTILHKYHLGDHGDQAFEWDLDGSEAKAWAEQVQKWKDEGIYGSQQECTWTVMKHPLFDDPIPVKPEVQRESYRMVILNLNQETNE